MIQRRPPCSLTLWWEQWSELVPLLVGEFIASYHTPFLPMKSSLRTQPSTSDQELSVALGQLRQRLVRRATSETAKRKIESTLRSMQRVDFLHNVFEPARLRGVHTVNTLSAGLVGQGAARTSDVLTSDGSMALMTPVGAAPERGTALTAEHLEAERVRFERVGHVVLNLIRHTSQDVKTQVTQQPLLINAGKTDLSPVGRSARRLLSAHFGDADRMDAASLEKHARAFQTDIVRVLMSLGA